MGSLRSRKLVYAPYMPPTENDDFEDAWALISPPLREPGETPLGRLQPGVMSIGTGRHGILVSINPDGSLEYGENYEPDEAARVFWEAMARQRETHEERQHLNRHMEGALTALGAADLYNEQVQLRLNERQTTENWQEAGRAQRALERAMSQAIELGRGMAQRPEIVPVPDGVPRTIRENPNSNYEGREGLGEQPAISSEPVSSTPDTQ